MSRNHSVMFDRNDDEEYEDCFDSCQKQCRLSAKSGRLPVRLFDGSSHPSTVNQSAGKYTGGPSSMVRFTPAPSANAKRFAASSAAGASRAIVEPSFQRITPSGNPLAVMRGETAIWSKNGQHAASNSRSGSQLAMRVARP